MSESLNALYEIRKVTWKQIFFGQDTLMHEYTMIMCVWGGWNSFLKGRPPGSIKCISCTCSFACQFFLGHAKPGVCSLLSEQFVPTHLCFYTGKIIHIEKTCTCQNFWHSPQCHILHTKPYVKSVRASFFFLDHSKFLKCKNSEHNESMLYLGPFMCFMYLLMDCLWQTSD